MNISPPPFRSGALEGLPALFARDWLAWFDEISQKGNDTYLDVPTLAREALSVTAPIVYNSATGAFSFQLGTANQIAGMNSAGTLHEYKTLTGTANRVTVTHAANSVVLSGPQDLHTGASPTFVGLTLTSGALSIASLTLSTALTLSYMTPGSVLFAGAGGLVSQDNANWFWDATNHRMGIGTAAPTVQAHIYRSTATTTPQLVIQQASTGDCALQFYHSYSSTYWSIGTKNYGSGSTARILHITPGAALDGSTMIGYDSSSQKSNFSTGIYSLNAFTGQIEEEVAIGSYALTSLTSSASSSAGNVAIGGWAGRGLINDSHNNVLIGYQSGANQSTPAFSDMVCVGAYSGLSLATGAAGEVLVGYYAGAYVSTGTSNTACGYSSLKGVAVAKTTGADNSAFGCNALFAAQGAAAANTAVGSAALYAVTTGTNNTGVGYCTGFTANTTGNVYLGYCAGYYETGSSKLFIDNAARTNEADARTKALIYGIFAAATAGQYLTVNANMTVSVGLTVGTLAGLILGTAGALTGIANVAAGQVLVSGTPPAWSASPTLTSLTLSSLTATRIPFAGTAGLLDDDANMGWDDVNKRFQVGGVAAPVSDLHVSNVTGGVITTDRFDTSVSAGDVVGRWDMYRRVA